MMVPTTGTEPLKAPDSLVLTHYHRQKQSPMI